ncbi:MAG: PAS domain S-box protein [Chloroflexota bacterium]
MAGPGTLHRHSDSTADARLHAIFESIDLIAIILDPDGCLQFANEALFRSTGWTRAEALDQDWFDRFLPDEVRRPIRTLFDQVVAQGEVPRQHEHELLTRDGRRRTVVWSNTLLKDADGRVTAVASIGDDVTDRRAQDEAYRADLQRTTAELREREDELRRTLGAVDAIISWSPREGGPLTVSPQIERILGWRPELIGDFGAWNALVHPDDLPACLATWRADPESWSMEYRMRRADGGYITVADRGRRYISENLERGTFGVVVDVTERVAAEIALADSEQRFRAIVEGVEAIVGFQEREGTGLQLSPQIERILGWRPDQVPDFETWHSLVHPDDIERCMEIWSVEPPTWQLEYRMRRADGTYAWVSDRGRKVPRSDGTGQFTFGIVVDSTERHQADEALRVSEERQRRTIESLDAIVAIQEHADAPIMCSPQFRQVLGIDPAEVTTFEQWRALVHPDDRHRTRALWEDRPETWEIEYRMRHADGHDVWVLDRGRRIAREDGLGEGTFGIIVDVTDRHAAAEALRTSEEQLRRIVEGVDVIISYQEAWDEPVHISPQTQRILGYPPEAVAPFDAWEAITHPDDLQMCRDTWANAEPTWDMDYRLKRSDGTWIWVNDRGRRIPHDDGRGAGMFGVVTEITAQHAAAERLRASEARFRAMFEENPEAIGVLRPVFSADHKFLDAEFLAANRTTRERWLGGVPVELVPGTRSSGLWFTAGEEVRAAVAAVAESGEAWRSQVRTSRDGQEYWSDLSVFPFEAGVAFVGRDVTDQKRSELAVRDSEARFRAVTDSAADAILTVDTSGTIVGWNTSAERMFGFAAGGLTGQPITALMPEPMVAGHLAAVGGHSGADGGPASGSLTQLEGRRVDGSHFPIEMSLASWTLDGKRYDTAIIRDVTERRLAEEAVREAAAFQRSVLDAIAEGMIIISPDLRITSANPRAAALLGVDMAALLSLTILEGWGPRRSDGEAMSLEEDPAVTTLRTGRSCRDVELQVLRPDGQRVWMRINTEPLLDRDGAVIAAVATFADITAEREMSEQLRRSQRLEAVGQLAGGVAHDFNNLLAAIRGYSELAMGMIPLDSAARSDVEEVIRAADRAAALTRQLLLFSRRQVLTPRAVDPAEVVDGLIPMLRQLVGEHIELVASHDPRRGVVLADPGQLEQVILNLVVNARDAMPGGGRIDVVTRRADPTEPVQLGPRPAWPAVRITVTDTGQGIDPTVLPHIFEPFYTTKEAGRGSGMGLATVYGIVGASGGSVSVATSPGRGTTFTIDLPVVADDALAAEADGDAADAAPATVGKPARGRVLLVEDDTAVRAILARQLALLGWSVDERSSGTSAAGAVASGEVARPDLLVSDVRMPGMQGPDLARLLRTVWPDLPVLFITGLADEVGAEADEPWMRVLTKPFDTEQLGRAIDAAVEVD